MVTREVAKMSVSERKYDVFDCQKGRVSNGKRNSWQLRTQFLITRSALLFTQCGKRRA